MYFGNVGPFDGVMGEMGPLDDTMINETLDNVMGKLEITMGAP